MTTIQHAELRIGLIGFGEVGSSFARGLLQEPGVSLAIYDQPPTALARERVQVRAAELGLTVSEDPAVLAHSDIVLSAVTQDAALDAARASSPWLRADALYLDISSLSPAAKRSAGAVVAAHGIAFVDGAIMTMPLRDLHRAHLLVSGDLAAQCVTRLGRVGMQLSVAGPHIGDAAAIKILRSVVVKGLEVLLVESLVAARRLGVEQAVKDSLAQLLDAQPAREFVDFLIESHPLHAARRAQEVDMSVLTLNEVSVQPLLAQAIVARLRQTAASPVPAEVSRAPQRLAAPDVLALLDADWQGLGQETE